MKTSNHNHNLQMSHILCLIETKIHHASIDMHKFINSLKYSYISINDGHGLMMLYDIHMHLDSFNIITNDSSKYIATTFNISICVATPLWPSVRMKLTLPKLGIWSPSGLPNL